MSDLKIDLHELAAARRRLAQATAAFENAHLGAHELADLTGHKRVAGKVRDFADNWDYHRGLLLQNMHVVLSGLEAIHDTFAEVDGSLARSLGEHAAASAKGGAT